MNRLEIQGSGFPGTNKTWRFIRDMINQVSQLTSLGGSNYIINGCEVVNDVVSDGYIVIDGELLPFTGGAIQDDVIIDQVVENTTYLEDANSDGEGDSKETYFTRSARFGSGAGSVPFSSLSKFNPLTEVKRRLVPEKSAIPFYGAINTIPEGWQLCDGTNGTPDLSGMFIVGYDPENLDYDAVGKQGGTKEVTLTENQMPSHNHAGNTNTTGSHRHSTQIRTDKAGNGNGEALIGSDNNDEGLVPYFSDYQGNHSHSFTTNNKGGGAAHENRPPYYVMAYITFVG